jgi:acyl-CoA synthetase (AMP-forming)/AMP-acid ligase II
VTPRFDNLMMSYPLTLTHFFERSRRLFASVVPKPGSALEPGEIIEFLRPQLARWALPDAVEIIDTVPKTSVGKFDKKVLRERYKNWTLPEPVPAAPRPPISGDPA